MKRAWEREKKTLARIYKGVTKRKTKIIDIPAETGELGFTSADGNIHLAQEHPIMDGLDADEKKFFRMGVFAHEMLHQIYSDFQVLKETQTFLNPMERQIYANLFNLIEDPAIEYLAPDVIGGSVLKALRFMIQTVYQKSPGIDESPEGFTQYASALVMFGDKGIIKGHFTDELAADMFRKTCGRFNEAVENPDPKFRSDMAVELMEETRPLWEIFSYEDLKKMLESFAGHESEEPPADGMGIPMPAGSGKKSDSAFKARKKIVSAMEEEPPVEAEPESDGEAESGKPDKTAEDNFCFEDDPSSATAGDEKAEDDDNFSFDEPEKTKGQKEENGTSDDDSFHFEEPENVSPDADVKDKGREENSPSPSDSKDDTDNKESNSEIKDPKQGMDGINEKLDADPDDMEDEITVDRKDLAWMDEADETSEKELQTEEKEAQEPGIDESIEPNFYPKGKYSMKNFNVDIAEHAIETYAKKYGEILQQYAVSKSAFVKRLKRIFDTDQAKKKYKKSGKVNIKRYTGSRKTARIFERRTAPKGIDDLAVTILVDESGSMNAREIYTSRCQIARECAIMLTESFADLKVPVYVLGFSADEFGYNAEHYHYIRWKNTLRERYRLLQIQARGNNFDSLSVNYASEILKKRHAEHKLLIVISDGVPACCAIDQKQGYADTKESIRIARKNMDVLGIAVGNDCTEQIQYLYGKNFMHVTNVNAAFSNISKEIAGIVKRW